MAQPMREMGRDACRRLFMEIGTAAERRTVEYAMTLIVRDSTGAPRLGPPATRKALSALSAD
jgi:DNA-binding LacI/PurR family transcriptional regulator